MTPFIRKVWQNLCNGIKKVRGLSSKNLIMKPPFKRLDKESLAFEDRSSHRRCSIKKGALKIFAIFTGKHLCWRLVLIKGLFNNYVTPEGWGYGHFCYKLLRKLRRGGAPLGKITSRGRPEDIPEKRSDVLRTSPYRPICNAKGRILSRTSLGRTQDVNLTIIHKMDFFGFFSIFPDSNCISDNALSK